MQDCCQRRIFLSPILCVLNADERVGLGWDSTITYARTRGRLLDDIALLAATMDNHKQISKEEKKIVEKKIENKNFGKKTVNIKCVLGGLRPLIP